jgi:hypothetical protein
VHIRRVENKVEVVRDPETDGQLLDVKYLMKVSRTPRGFVLQSCADLGGEDLWQVIRFSFPSSGYQLKSGDVMKIGRLQFQLHLQPSFENFSDSTSSQDSDTSPSAQCRVCLAEGDEVDNPLISPCACIGSMRYVHYMCQQRWIESRMIERTAVSFSAYNWKSLDCELCKRALPVSFITGGKAFDSEFAEKLENPSLVLESVDREKSTNKGVMALKIEAGSSVKFGRGHESDIRITDISVSRVHCSIKSDEGRYFIADETSKFGTLVKLQEALSLTTDCELTIQAGRTILRIEVRQDNSTRKPNFDNPIDE